jgi:hypothetical protein
MAHPERASLRLRWRHLHPRHVCDLSGERRSWIAPRTAKPWAAAEQDQRCVVGEAGDSPQRDEKAFPIDEDAYSAKKREVWDS